LFEGSSTSPIGGDGIDHGEVERIGQWPFTGFDDKILALYVRGMTVRENQGFLAEMYAVEVTPDLISTVSTNWKVQVFTAIAAAIDLAVALLQSHYYKKGAGFYDRHPQRVPVEVREGKGSHCSDEGRTSYPKTGGHGYGLFHSYVDRCFGTVLHLGLGTDAAEYGRL